MVTLAAGFAFADWVVLLAYFAVLVATGVVLSRREQASTEDYFLGGRRMPVWAVAVSVLATSMSAATFVGGPQQSYDGDLTYLSSYLGFVLAGVVVAVWFIPAMYRGRVQTVYQLLDGRLGSGAGRAASAAFMVGRVFASGARLYIVAIPAALIMFGDRAGSAVQEWQLLVAIGAMTAVGIVYTLAGGIASVIWSDVIQTVVFVGAVVGAIVVLVWKIPLTPGEIAHVLDGAQGPGGASKLTVISLSMDHSSAYSLWAVLVGFTLLGVAAFGTDQDLTQRMLTCRSARSGAWSAVWSQLIGIPVVLLFLVAGLLLYVFYQRADVMGAAAPKYTPDDSRTVFLSFILREMPAGMSGLMMAGLFAAGLSSLNSAINAMASTFVADFYTRWRPGREPGHYVRVGRLAVVGWGLALCGFAVVSIFWQRASGGTLIDFALGVMTFAYSGLLGVYFSALFTRRGSTRSAIAALVVGFVAVLVMQSYFWGGVGWAWGAVTGDGFDLARAKPIAWLVALAFPWKLTLAAGLSFAACQCGARRGE